MSDDVLLEHSLFSVDDAAKVFGVTRRTVTRLIRTKELPAEKAGNKWVIRSNHLKKYLKARNLVPEPCDHPRLSVETPDVIALSFFSGALGLDYGFEQAGIFPALLCENDHKCRMTIDSMRPKAALIGDIMQYSSDEILRFARIPKGKKVDVMFGGPPCQAFSTAGARRAFSDARGNVFLKYIELAPEIHPTYVVIENVRGLLSAPFPIEEGADPIKGGAMYIVLSKLKKAGYSVSFNLYNAANFGAAQIRERVVLIGKIGSEKMPYLTPTHSETGSYGLPRWKTFSDVTSDLSEAQMHHTQFPEKRLKYFRMLTEGQCWRNLPLDVQPEAMGKSYALSGGKTGFYRRISFDRPCPTLVTTPTMPATDLCHPTQNRPLSIEEYKRVQGFPDNWSIRGNLMDMYKQIGNAVPIALGKAIGAAICNDINEVPPPGYADFPYSRYKKTSDKTWKCG